MLPAIVRDLQLAHVGGDVSVCLPHLPEQVLPGWALCGQCVPYCSIHHLLMSSGPIASSQDEPAQSWQQRHLAFPFLFVKTVTHESQASFELAILLRMAMNL